MFVILLITIFALGVGLGFCALQIVTSSKNKTISLLQDECKELEITLFRTKAEIQEHKQILQDKQNKIDHLENSISLLSNQRADLINSVEDLKEAAKRNADSLFEANIEVANTHFEMAAEKLCLENQELQKQYKSEYLQLLNESTKAFEETISNYLQQKEKLEKEIESLRSVVDAAVEANRRKLEEEEKENFYRLILTETDRNEIKMLREVLPYIKNAEALNKVIWTIYYQKPYTDLIGRVFGDKKPCGIYKITNLQNQMVYVGQSVKLAGEKLFPVIAGGY